MSSSKQMVTNLFIWFSIFLIFQIIKQHQQEYLELIIKQKTQAIDRQKQKSQVDAFISQDEQELLR
jgi:hypothetical protein